jgi:5-bromo-4-chloroindolyl phosphate hydrolysis protein
MNRNEPISYNLLIFVYTKSMINTVALCLVEIILSLVFFFLIVNHIIVLRPIKIPNTGVSIGQSSDTTLGFFDFQM